MGSSAPVMVASIDTWNTHYFQASIMPSNAKVYINYGPYLAVGTVEHRLSRLQGLKCVLTKDGHTVEFVELEDWDAVELSVNGEIVFKCDINNLDYGSDGELDPLCAKAREAVMKAY